MKGTAAAAPSPTRRALKAFLRSPSFADCQVASATAALQAHITAGHIVILISASPLHVTRLIGEHFGAHVACGSVCPEREGIYVRAQHGNTCLVGENKQKALDHLVSRYNIDLSASFAYGDHPTDIDVLSRVGNPRVVNPTTAMERIADKRGWKVLPGSEQVNRGATGLLTAISSIVKAAQTDLEEHKGPELVPAPASKL